MTWYPNPKCWEYSLKPSIKRPGNKTHAVQSCDSCQQRPLHWNVTIIHIGTTAPQEAEPPRNNPSGTDSTDSTSALELLGETEGWMGNWGWGTFKFTCVVIFEKILRPLNVYLGAKWNHKAQ